jgi:cysteine synthase
MIAGPTFEEMLHPDKYRTGDPPACAAAHTDDPLDPINLYNITWRANNEPILTSSCRGS